MSVGLRDSGSALHREAIFKDLGITVDTVYMAPPDSADALVKGNIDAFVCFCLASPGIYQHVMFNADLHLLPIPFEAPLQRDYLPATLGHDDFPSFIAKDGSVSTVAVTLVLITYKWDKGNPRYARVASSCSGCSTISTSCGPVRATRAGDLCKSAHRHRDGRVLPPLPNGRPRSGPRPSKRCAWPSTSF